MAIVLVENIRVADHLADLRCDNPTAPGGPCTYAAADVNVNTGLSYAQNPMTSEDDPNYIVVPCPTCGSVSTYPTFDERNTVGYQLGQAKTA